MGNAASSEYAGPCQFTQDLLNTDGTTTTQTFQGVDHGDTALMMFGTTLVMLQTPAMGIAQAGMIRRKNSLSMMMQCMSGMAIGSLLWWAIGHGLAFGPDLNGDGFIGNPWPYLFFKDLPRGGESPVPLCYPAAASIPATVHAAFQMMFALMVPVIVTGAWAEKMTMKSFLMFVTLWPILCYYPQTHWLWGPNGWLAAEGAKDFAGGMNIHTSAGCAGLVVSKMLAPRRNLEKLRMTHHNIPLLVIGGTIVWAGWYSFNGCSALAGTASAAAALLNTHLSASTSGLTWVLLTYRQDRCFHVTDMMNGAFAGLAGITPGSGFVPDWASVVTGFLVGCASWWTCGYFKDRLKIDDTLDCFSLQATPGMLGSILVGLWAKGPEFFDDSVKDDIGIFYGGTGKLLGAQIAGVLSCAVWTMVMTYIVMLVIKHTVGYDITVQMEDEGLDKTQIGEIGYDIVGTSDSYMASDEDKTQELIEACARGNLGLVRKMVAAGAGAGRGDYDARTPLHLAAANGQQHIVQFLVESCKQSVKVDAQDNFGGTPLQDAMEGGHTETIAYLKQHGGTIDETKYVGMLNEAAFAGDARAVHAMITKQQVPVNGGDYDDRTALHIAVCEGHTAVVHVLMAAGADEQARDRWQQTPLDNAEAFGRHNLVPVLNKAVKSEFDEAALPGRGDRAEFDKDTVGIMTTATKEMCAAASGGDKELVKTLLKKGGAANVADYDGRTPLHLAAAAGHIGVVKVLAKQAGVSINCVDRFASTPLQEAAKSGHHKLAEWLRQNGASTVNQKYGYALCCAARDGDVEKLQTFVDAGVDLGTADYDGRTALHLAACRGDAKTCQFVLDNLDSDDNVNTLDRMRRTPLDDATGGAKAVIAGKGGKAGAHFTDSVGGAVEEQASAAGTV